MTQFYWRGKGGFGLIEEFTYDIKADTPLVKDIVSRATASCSDREISVRNILCIINKINILLSRYAVFECE